MPAFLPRRPGVLLCASLAACAGVETRAPIPLSELRSRDVILQAHEYSCGAAALATLLGLLGRPTTEMEVLRSIFGERLPLETGPEGKTRLRALNLEDLETGARAAGFQVVSLQVPAKSLPDALIALRPAIARMSLYKQYPHFVVLRDFRDGWAQIGDPAYGSIKLPASQFFSAWEAGDRILLTISRHPFYAWKTRDDRPLLLKRNEREPLPPSEALDPAPLLRAAHVRMTQLGSWPR